MFTIVFFLVTFFYVFNVFLIFFLERFYIYGMSGCIVCYKTTAESACRDFKHFVRQWSLLSAKRLICELACLRKVQCGRGNAKEHHWCHQKAATPRLMKRRLAETDRSNGVDNLMRWAAVVIACSCPSMVVRPTRKLRLQAGSRYTRVGY